MMSNFLFEYMFSSFIAVGTLVTFMLMKENAPDLNFVQMILMFSFLSLLKCFMQHKSKNNCFVNVNFTFISYKNRYLFASIAAKIVVYFDKLFEMF